MANNETATQDWEAVAVQNNADLIMYCGPIKEPHDRELLDQIESRKKLRPNVILWLATLGGDPHAAYRISRTLQRHYRTLSSFGQNRGKFTVFVDTICKSAGTIVVLGSDRLVLTDYAELGPIDPQLRKPDEGVERSSSLTPMQALSALQSTSFELFGYFYRRLRANTTWNLTTKTASEIAGNMTKGLLEPIYGQIDPIRLGEIDRFTKVSLKYGENLDNGNLLEDAVERLVAGYPSHNFVIDRIEAKELFRVVDEPDEAFRRLSAARDFTENRLGKDRAVVFFLSEEPVEI